LKSNKNEGNLHIDLSIFMIISSQILLIMRNILDTGSRKNQNLFDVQKFLSETSFKRPCRVKFFLDTDRPQTTR